MTSTNRFSAQRVNRLGAMMVGAVIYGGGYKDGATIPTLYHIQHSPRSSTIKSPDNTKPLAKTTNSSVPCNPLCGKKPIAELKRFSYCGTEWICQKMRVWCAFPSYLGKSITFKIPYTIYKKANSPFERLTVLKRNEYK